MSWSDVTLLYEVLTVIMVAVCILAYAVNRHTLDLFAAAVVVFAFTMMSTWIVSTYDPPWSSAHMPPQDLICALVAWWSAGRSGAAWWPRWLAVAMTVQCGIHVIYWGAIALSFIITGGQEVAFMARLYPWPINALFLIELAILTGAGGGHVAGYVRTRLPLFRRGVAHPRSHRGA